jgi:hypothetical protein
MNSQEERFERFGGRSADADLGEPVSLGQDFERTPADWVTVWRECSPEELIVVTQHGLAVPAPANRPPEYRQEMELLDSFRPSVVSERGISRLRSIYASPSPEDVPCLPHRRERLVVEMRIDPRQAYVGDMDFITGLISFMGANKFGIEQFHGAYRKYWDSVMPLTYFLDRYRREDTADGGHWRACRAVAERLPQTYYAPEVMIMTPLVSQRHIRLAR